MGTPAGARAVRRGGPMLLLLLLLSSQLPGLAVIAAPTPPPGSALELLRSQKGINLWLDVLQAAGITPAQMAAGPARYVALVPSDSAVRAFLADMGLSSTQDLKERPALAKQLVAEHLVLGLPSDAQQRLVDGRLTSVPTAAAAAGPGNSSSELHVALRPGGADAGGRRQLVLTDALGQTARGVDFLRLDASKVAIILDRVLASGHYYSSFAQLCEHRKAVAAPTCDALVRSGVLSSLSSPWRDTLFFPGAKAWAAQGLRVADAPRDVLRPLVQFAVVPGLRAFPGGFLNGSTHTTLLPGASLKIEYERLDPPSGPGAVLRGSDDLAAYVISPSGQRVPVVLYDVFVGRGVVHGIPALILPPGFDRGAAGAAGGKPGPAQQQPGGAAAPAKAAAAAGGAQRGLLGFPEQQKVIMPLNAAETDIRDRVRKQFRDNESLFG